MEITQKSDKKEITEFLHRRSSELGHTVLKNEVSGEERRTVIKAFGSWNNAVAESRLEPANSHNQTALRIAQYNSAEEACGKKEKTIWKK